MPKKVAIIGGGASGLICAILCAKNGLDVTLYEQNEKCAKKILVSGNGRCNITNTSFSKANYSSSEPDFVSYALEAFSFRAFEKFVNAMGLLLHTNADGRCYPLSNEAKSVAHLFVSQAKALGVNFLLDSKVTSAKALLKKYNAVVVATGSQAAPHLGGNSDGMEFAREFGHTIIPTYPSLVQLHIDNAKLHKMAGAKVDGEVTLYINNTKEQSVQGDILFTNYGLSGLAILDISQRASEALAHGQSVSLSLNLLPNFSHQQLTAHLLQVAKEMPSLSLFELLIGLIPLKIATNILEILNLSSSQSISTLQTKLAKQLANALLNWRVDVSQTHGFRHAEVSGGGVNTQEIEPKTMESKKQKNLYFIGEVLDVVGERGGYNFAWSWASGVSAAKHISQK